MADTANEDLQSVMKRDSITFRGIFAVSFLVLLMVALVMQVLPMQWRTWFPGAEGGHALISDVRSAVYTFMSHLT